MSRLETANRSAIGAMLGDAAITLTDDEQTLLARWAMKTAMMVDSVTGKSRPTYYRQGEREALRTSMQLPELATVWIARFSGSSLGSFGTDIGVNVANVPKPCDGSVNTILVGHLAIQSVHARIADYGFASLDVQTKPGPWNGLLVQIWPIQTRIAQWPPPLSFDLGSLHFNKLHDRWRMGKAL